MPYETCRFCKGVESAYEVCAECDGTGIELRDERIVANEACRAALELEAFRLHRAPIIRALREAGAEIERLKAIIAEQRALLAVAQPDYDKLRSSAGREGTMPPWVAPADDRGTQDWR